MTEHFKKLFSELGLSPEEAARKLQILQGDMKIPARIIGVGQTGVGKTELLKSIFRISEEHIKDYLAFKGQQDDFDMLETGSVRSVTKNFFSFTIENPQGFRVQFTDGPGLGESGDKENQCFEMWVDEIPKHDLLYWVLDASSRDMAHIQINMKRILDRTGYRKRFVLVLNKVDQILLPLELELRGVVGWDPDLDEPSKALLDLITARTDDIIEKVTKYVDIAKDQIVVCSARKRWNHGPVLDTFLRFLPETKRIKVSLNREVKDFTELMSPKGREMLGENQNGQGKEA